MAQVERERTYTTRHQNQPHTCRFTIPHAKTEKHHCTAVKFLFQTIFSVTAKHSCNAQERTQWNRTHATVERPGPSLDLFVRSGIDRIGTYDWFFKLTGVFPRVGECLGARGTLRSVSGCSVIGWRWERDHLDSLTRWQSASESPSFPSFPVCSWRSRYRVRALLPVERK